MDEGADFDVRAVLVPRRARRSRLALLIPAVALAITAWAGVSGPRSGPTTAETRQPPGTAASAPVAVASDRASVQPPRNSQPPTTAVGLEVHRLDQIDPRGLGPDNAIAIAGWYVTTSITDCPPMDAIYRNGALPYLRGDADTATFCRRTGVLYAAPPDGQRGFRGAGLSAVKATVAIGVIVPLGLEAIGAEPTQVVIVGRFTTTIDPCDVAGHCVRELVVDHIAWTPAT
jgi:hypothetical protein